jgi:hypothetical protein
MPVRVGGDLGQRFGGSSASGARPPPPADNASQTHRRLRWAVGRTEYHATMIIRQAHPGAPRLRAQYLLLAILCTFIPGCSPDPHPALAPLALYAAEQRDINGTTFAKMPAEQTDAFLAALRSAQIVPDTDRSWLFVPALGAYPGWFDLGLAPKAAENPASLTLDGGRLRIFRGENASYIMLLSEAAARSQNRLLPALGDAENAGATVPAIVGRPRPWWRFWR